jgi:hypothetical protein
MKRELLRYMAVEGVGRSNVYGASDGFAAHRNREQALAQPHRKGRCELPIRLHRSESGRVRAGQLALERSR